MLTPTTTKGEAETREWIREKIRGHYGERLLRTCLVGSRATGTARKDSDWDVVILTDAGPLGPERKGPVIMEKWLSPTGSWVEVVEVRAIDFENHRCRFFVEARRDAQPL